jgi:hypothetical protein
MGLPSIRIPSRASAPLRAVRFRTCSARRRLERSIIHSIEPIINPTLMEIKMRKTVRAAAVIALALVGSGATAAMACDWDRGYRSTRAYGYSYAPRYAYYGYRPRYYGYGPAARVRFYGYGDGWRYRRYHRDWR